MSTFLSYPGGKSRMSPLIAQQLAPHDIYVEPFCGTASVLFAKPRANFELINDSDRRLVTLLKVVRDRADELAAVLALSPYARSEYEEADVDDPDADEVEIARRVCVRVGQSFAKTGLAGPGRGSGWRVSVRGGRPCGMTWSDLPDRVLAACERLRGVHIDNLPALDLIKRYGVEPAGALYVDPPYLGSTRVRAIYAQEMPTEDEHRELADALQACTAHVLLSGYHSPLYDELYDGWDTLEVAAVANHNGNADSDPRRVEVLWSNRPLGRQQSMEMAA